MWKGIYSSYTGNLIQFLELFGLVAKERVNHPFASLLTLSFGFLIVSWPKEQEIHVIPPSLYSFPMMVGFYFGTLCVVIFHTDII